MPQTPKPSYCLYLDGPTTTRISFTSDQSTHEQWIRMGLHTYMFPGDLQSGHECTPGGSECGKGYACVSRFGPGPFPGMCEPAPP